MIYRRWYSGEFERALAEIKNRDKELFERLTRKIDKIKENPTHYGFSIYRIKGICHAFMGKSIIIYFDVVEDLVRFHYVGSR